MSSRVPPPSGTTKRGIAIALFGVAIASVPACSMGDDPPASEADAGAPVDGDAAAPEGPPCGRLTTPCAPGGRCEGPLDCATNVCRDGVCNDVAPADGKKNGDETDVDCGGAHAPACADGKGCAIAADCTSAVCTGGSCQPPSPTDAVKNGDETDVDCGGANSPKCKTGQGCAGDADCDDVRCDATQKKCKAPSDDDGILNGDETGKDCGGPTSAKKCPPGEGCASDADCDKTRCNTTTKVCNPPAKDDGLANGSETDVDCGGAAPTNAPRCAEGKTCAVDGDCADPFCSFDKKCVTARSCKGTVGDATAGITTCGRYESNNPAKAHESCCRSLPLPTTKTVRLDKYEVTAGRFRQFVESIPNKNVRQWVATEIGGNTEAGKRLAVDIPANVRSLLPASMDPGDPMNIVLQTGAVAMDNRVPSDLQGCFTDWQDGVTGAYGHPTYWWPQSVLQQHVGNSDYGGPNKGRRFTQQQYDEKSMNCAPYWLYAAFCAWDGGRLPTYDEMFEAWGPNTYPWNTATYSFPLPPSGGQTYEDTANYWNNQFSFYGYPGFGDARDLAGLIAAPGRFIKDKTARTSANGEAWLDLGANLMEMTRAIPGGVPGLPGYSPGAAQGSTTFCDFSLGGPGGNGCPAGSTFRASGLTYSAWVGGSWEGHYRFATTPEPYFEKVSYNYSLQTQYGKTGVRCARATLP